MATTEHDPFILDRPTAPRISARGSVICIGVAVLLLLLLEGASIRRSGERMDPGLQRTVVRAVGAPAGWLADRLPIGEAAGGLTSWLSPDEKLAGPGGFETPAAGTSATAGAGVPTTITPDAFDPAALGEKPVRLSKLGTLLVTGDSMSQPLDVELARGLAASGVRTVRDAHLGSGISKTSLVDWGRLSSQQARERKPEAVVVFLGANEGFPLPGAGKRLVSCCGPTWAALYATRARKMMDTYRRSGAARVYWLTLPLPRDPARQTIVRSVNAAVAVAAQPYRAQVRILDMAQVFTPAGRFRPAMDVDGKGTVVREPDGIHLNDAGAKVAAGLVQSRLKADFDSLR
ncbi:MAG TPA: GDSL-type esterase/lipase family protein [Solirubrobacteraceae bacterium]